MDWIALAQGRDSCPALVNAMMNLRVPQKAGNFLTLPHGGSSSYACELFQWTPAQSVKDQNAS